MTLRLEQWVMWVTWRYKGGSPLWLTPSVVGAEEVRLHPSFGVRNGINIILKGCPS